MKENDFLFKNSSKLSIITIILTSLLITIFTFQELSSIKYAFSSGTLAFIHFTFMILKNLITYILVIYINICIINKRNKPLFILTALIISIIMLITLSLDNYNRLSYYLSMLIMNREFLNVFISILKSLFILSILGISIFQLCKYIVFTAKETAN